MEENILEFGIKRKNEERRDGGGAVIFDPETQKYAVYRRLDNNWIGLFGGGVDKNEDIEEGVIREVIEESGLNDFSHIEKIDEVIAHYYHSVKKVNRVTRATFFLLVLKSKNLINTALEDHENFILDWVDVEEIILELNSRNNEKNYDHWIYFLEKSTKRLKELGHI